MDWSSPLTWRSFLLRQHQHLSFCNFSHFPLCSLPVMMTPQPIHLLEDSNPAESQQPSNFYKKSFYLALGKRPNKSAGRRQCSAVCLCPLTQAVKRNTGLAAELLAVEMRSPCPPSVDRLGQARCFRVLCLRVFRCAQGTRPHLPCRQVHLDSDPVHSDPLRRA